MPQFQIKDTRGHLLFANFDEKETILDVKTHIEKLWKIPVINQILITRSTPFGTLDENPTVVYLDNDKCIGEYKIGLDTPVYLFRKSSL